MEYTDRFDSLLKYYAGRLFPEGGWRLIKCQMIQESGANPKAVSPVGALGLMQLMPGTAKEMGLEQTDYFDAEKNIEVGVRYLRIQFDRFPEIPSLEERGRFALASYNGGRGYVNRALALAYEVEFGRPMPPGHRGAMPGSWRTWKFTKGFLAVPECAVNGRRPDARQMTEYVERIWERLEKMLLNDRVKA